jgi:hypothetical protein
MTQHFNLKSQKQTKTQMLHLTMWPSQLHKRRVVVTIQLYPRRQSGGP